MSFQFDVTPVYHANYNSKSDIVINQGGTDCFAPSTLVVTSQGEKPICELEYGDQVKSYNEETKTEEFNKVLNVFKFENQKRTIKVKLKNGSEIIATEDHEFFYEGGWYSLKYLLSLVDGRMEKDTEL